MIVEGRAYRSIWVEDDKSVAIVDQTKLPHRFEVAILRSCEDAAAAISDMQVRGAPLIGAAAAYGVALAMREDDSDAALHFACATLRRTRPTAVNLAWALDEMRALLAPLAPLQRCDAAFAGAAAVADEDVATNEAIGDHGFALIRETAKRKAAGGPVNILTHCNAGWLATVDWGTATAPIYKAHERGVPVHVWVDETRPRNQGAGLTAWEFANHGVPHTVIVDNAGGHLMQKGAVDLVLVGTDRVTAAGDVCNKIGTYLKALAAFDTGVPFYVAAPSPSIDFSIENARDIPIEERDCAEVTHVIGETALGTIEKVRVTPRASPARNYAFDVTPARLITRLVTERGIIEASREALRRAFPDRARQRGRAGFV